MLETATINKQTVDLNTVLPSNKQNVGLDTVLPSNLNIGEAILNDDLDLSKNVSSREQMSINSKNRSVDSKSDVQTKNSRSQSSNTSMSRSTKSDINAVTKIEISRSGNIAFVGMQANESTCSDNDSDDSDQSSSEILEFLTTELKSSVFIHKSRSNTQLGLEKETKTDLLGDQTLEKGKNPSKALDSDLVSSTDLHLSQYDGGDREESRYPYSNDIVKL